MNIRLSLACAFLACAAASVAVRAEPAGTQNMSRSDLRHMVQNARTSEDFLTLASYYRWRQQELEQQAQSEKMEWARRAMNPFLVAAKYPNPVDSSKYRFQYFSYEAQKMSAQAAHFEGLSAKAAR